MTCAASIQLSPELIVHRSKHTGLFEKGRLNGCNIYLSSHSMRHDTRGLHLLTRVHMPIRPVSSKFNVLVCRSALLPTGGNEIPLMKSAAVVLTRTYTALCGKPFVFRLIPAVGVIAFAVWGLGPLMRLFRVIFFQRSDKSWMKSRTYYIVCSYLRPSLLCIGATLLCRTLDLVVLPSEASQAVKQRILHFVRTLSTVLAFAYFLSSLIQQARNFFMEMNDSSDAKNMGFDLAGKAAFTAVWIAAVSLFMELLGFSTKWLTFGGFGTVLITLAGREILTNFLSSVMIHATKPFVVNEWIQTKIEGNEVSGTVEEVGWWKPTIVRGDDREKLYIPNHKFSASVVRNLSQKTHWRIKTHLAISYLDANKVANIVADMRKVLAKNPQVEQKKLHRRVYLETINPENPALMILISCFVSTSHIEEYLRVKEVVLLDLLGVISHHKARLATPIRRIQKMYNEADLDDIPFTDPIFSGRASRRVPLMIEPPYKIYGDEKDQPSTRSGQINGEKDKVEAVSTLDPKANPDSGSAVDSKEDRLTALQSVQGDSTVTKQPGNDKSENEAAVKQDAERRQPASATVNKTALEDNILLGVALDGSKRTLPIGEETSPKDTQVPLAPGAAQNDK